MLKLNSTSTYQIYAFEIAEKKTILFASRIT